MHYIMWLMLQQDGHIYLGGDVVNDVYTLRDVFQLSAPVPHVLHRQDLLDGFLLKLQIIFFDIITCIHYTRFVLTCSSTAVVQF